MTRIALVADVHIANHRRWGGPVHNGLNRRGAEAISVLHRACITAREAGCSRLFVLGDLFDTSRPSPPLVSAVINALMSGPPATILLGNHDRQSQDENDHAAAPIDWVQNIDVITQTTVSHIGATPIICVPYQPGLASEWVHEQIEAVFPASSRPGHEANKPIVLTHVGIWDDTTPSYLKSARDAIGLGQARWLCDTYDLQLFAAGNWHLGKLWTNEPEGHTVLIPSTLCPHSFSDAGFNDNIGTMHIWDTNRGHTTPVRIAGPRFFTGDFDMVSKTQAGPKGSDWSSYYRVRVPRADLDKTLALRDDMERTMNAYMEVEVIDDAPAVHEAAAAAIKASDGDLTEDYADLASVTEPGTREGVRARLAAYRKAAG